MEYICRVCFRCCRSDVEHLECWVGGGLSPVWQKLDNEEKQRTGVMEKDIDVKVTVEADGLENFIKGVLSEAFEIENNKVVGERVRDVEVSSLLGFSYPTFLKDIPEPLATEIEAEAKKRGRK